MWGLAEERFLITSIADADTQTLNEAFHNLTGNDR